MASHARRPDIREALWSLAFALWSVAWPAGIVFAGGSTPGFLSLRGDAGLREVVEARVPLSYGIALSTWAVLAFVAMWALLRFWRWLEPDRQSIAAIRWAFSSRSLNLTVIALALAAFVLTWAGQSESVVTWLGRISPGLVRFLVAWWWLILLITAAILSPLVLLCLLNPLTLARERLERWWRPFWPGLTALVISTVCWLGIRMLLAIALDAMPASVPAPWSVVWHALEYAILTASDLAAFAWWFSRGRMADAKALGACFFRWSTLRVYLGFDLLFALILLMLCVPVIWLSIFNIYIGPQYEEWQRIGIVDMPMAYALLMDWGRSTDAVMPGLLSAFGLMDLLFASALGRLLYRRAMIAGAIPGHVHADVDGAGR